MKQMELKNEILQGKINQLEMCLKTKQKSSNEYNERVSTQQMEGRSLSVEVKNLHSVFHSKTVEMETQSSLGRTPAESQVVRAEK